MQRVQFRRVPAVALAVAGIVLAACGSDGTGGSADTVAPSPTFETNEETSAIDIGAGVDPAQPAVDPADDGGSGESGSGDAGPVETGSPDGGPVSDEPAVVEVQPAVLGGRALEAAVSPASDVASNMLPDLVVDDVRRESKANFRNIFPSDRPVLLWLWAPH